MNGSRTLNKPKKLKNVIILFAVLLLSVNTAVLVNLLSAFNSSASSSAASLPPQKLKEYALKLKADGLMNQSEKAFEEYLKYGDSDEEQRSNVYYSLGEMFMHSSMYEKALAYFYKAEIAYPDTGLKKEIGSYIVTCLEKLDRPLDAEYQLESRSVLPGEKKQLRPSGEVVARIGKRTITMGELDDAISELPAGLREEYMKNDKRKNEFLEQYIATELLFDKGVKLGYERDPELRQQIDIFTRQLIVQKVLEEETGADINYDLSDIKNYYEANKEKYKDDKGELRPFDEVKQTAAMDYKLEKRSKRVREMIEKSIRTKDVEIYSGKIMKNPPEKDTVNAGDVPGDDNARKVKNR